MSREEESRRAESELNKLRKLPENKKCANCFAPGAPALTAVVVPFKIFVCSNCKSAHQAFSHRCKSTQMSLWTMDEVRALEERNGGGNKVAQDTFLAGVRDDDRPREGDSLDKCKEFVKRAYIDKIWLQSARAREPEHAARTRPTAPPSQSHDREKPSSAKTTPAVQSVDLLSDLDGSTAPIPSPLQGSQASFPQPCGGFDPNANATQAQPNKTSGADLLGFDPFTFTAVATSSAVPAAEIPASASQMPFSSNAGGQGTGCGCGGGVGCCGGFGSSSCGGGGGGSVGFGGCMGGCCGGCGGGGGSGPGLTNLPGSMMHAGMPTGPQQGFGNSSGCGACGSGLAGCSNGCGALGCTGCSGCTSFSGPGCGCNGVSACCGHAGYTSGPCPPCGSFGAGCPQASGLRPSNCGCGGCHVQNYNGYNGCMSQNPGACCGCGGCGNLSSCAGCGGFNPNVPNAGAVVQGCNGMNGCPGTKPQPTLADLKDNLQRLYAA
eukprot:s5115_g1.t1